MSNASAIRIATRKARSALWHAERYARYFWWQQSPVRRRGRPHNLNRPLIVSLTSFPPRFQTLPLTLKCLLSQTLQPDEVVLWIAHDDRPLLTEAITSLQRHGLTLRFCSDTKSFKKIIPSLTAYPGSYVVTADDDICYRGTWLEELVSEYEGDDTEVICHRAHRIELGADGLPLSYAKWEWQTRCLKRSHLIFPTGGGGVLYPPGIFDTRVTDQASFSSLCPTADDIWLYWMMRLTGATARHIGGRPLMYWPGSQTTALSRANVSGDARNDDYIAQMAKRYGFPA